MHVCVCVCVCVCVRYIDHSDIECVQLFHLHNSLECTVKAMGSATAEVHIILKNEC